MGRKVLVFDEITSAGATASIDVGPYDEFVIAVESTGVSGSVVMRLEGKIPGSGWFNLDAAELDTTITANKTTAFELDGANISEMRLAYVSGTGTLNARAQCSDIS